MTTRCRVDLLLMAALSLATSVADAGSFGLRIVADNRGQFSEFGPDASINCAGDVAFVAGTTKGAGVFATNGATFVTIRDAPGKIRDYGKPSINDSGTVAFTVGSTPGRNPEAMIGSGTSTPTVITGGYGSYIGNPAINNAGQIAYFGQHGTSGVFINDGRRIVPISNVDDAFQEGGTGNYVAVNDAGEVAFAGMLKDGTRGIFVGNGATHRVIATAGDLADSFWEPAINEMGTVVFRGQNPSRAGLYRGKGGAVTTIADTARGPFVAFQSSVSVNNSDTVAFWAWLSMQPEVQGIFVGPDPVRNKVIQTGDLLSGVAVKSVWLGPSAINDSGQVAFQVLLADGRRAVVVATPEGVSGRPAQCTRSVQAPAAAASQPYAELQRAVGPSRWLEAEREQHTRLLQSVGYDALVVPFQANGNTLDAPGRSMLARTIAVGLERSAGLRVADPGLVEKALGEPARNVSLRDVFALGEKLGVKHVIVGSVQHDRNYHMTVTVNAWSGPAGKVTIESKRQKWQRDKIAFSDINLPEMAFRPLADQAVAALLSRPVAPARVGASGSLGPALLPGSWGDVLAQSALSPLAQALQLELLGSLYPADQVFRAREQLFERALIVLDGVAPSPDRNLLKARALIALHRRPAALAVLGKPANPAGHAMLAYLNGDLPGLEKHTSGIQEPVLKLLAEFDLQDIKFAYYRPLDEERAAALAAETSPWSPLIVRRFVDGDPWSGQSHAWTKMALDALLPAGTLSLEDLVKGKQAEGSMPDAPDLARSVMDHEAAAYRGRAQRALAERRGTTAPWEGDLLQLAVADTVASVIGESRAERNARGRPRQSMDILRRYESILADNPLFTLELNDPPRFPDFSRGMTEAQAAKFRDDADQSARKGFVWLGQQNEATIRIADSAEYYFPEVKSMSADVQAEALFIHDFPHRLGFMGFPGEAFPDYRESARHCAAYTITALHCVVQQGKNLLEGPPPNPKAAAEVLRQLDYRFIGHPDRLQALADVKRKSGAKISDQEVFQQAVEEGVAEWKPYETVGAAFLRQGRYGEAHDAFMKYPGFHGQHLTDDVVLSNYAYLAGSYLFWTGRHDEARPFYELSAGLNTGSDASLTSESRVALLDKDLALAAELSLARAQRYDSVYAYRDYMALLHVLGESEAAWALFDTLIPRLYGGEKWTSAYVGHRLSGASYDDIIEWAASPRRRRDLPHGTDKEPGRFVFLMGVVDRLPPQDFPQRVRKAGGDARMETAAKGLAQFYRNEMPGAYAALKAIGTRRDMQEFLPYFAWSAVVAGQSADLESDLSRKPASATESPDRDPGQIQADRFYDELALATITGLRGDDKASIQHLRNAVNDRPFTEEKVIFTDYQVIELAERLYASTHDKEYQAFALDLARRFQAIQPMYAWIYAIAARLATSPDERIQYLATAMHLDPHSWRVSQMSEDERKAARQWLAIHGPLYQSEGKSQAAASPSLPPADSSTPPSA